MIETMSRSDQNFHSWEKEFLTWFALKNIPIEERALCLGSLKYFLVSSRFETKSGRTMTSHGRSENRADAAVKCVAEFVERYTLSSLFEEDCYLQQIPKLLRTSNGAAVHKSKQQAEQNAKFESLERHLLLKSFFTYGWDGFSLHDCIKTDGITIYLLTSRFVCEGMISGIVVARSEKYPGVTFGYSFGAISDLNETSFWERALFEALDQILVLDGKSIILGTDPTWMKRNTKFYLETEFRIEFKVANPIETFMPQFLFSTHELSGVLNLTIPLFFSHSRSEEALPLFNLEDLDDLSSVYIEPILERNSLNIKQLPKKHPIL